MNNKSKIGSLMTIIVHMDTNNPYDLKVIELKKEFISYLINKFFGDDLFLSSKIIGNSTEHHCFILLSTIELYQLFNLVYIDINITDNSIELIKDIFDNKFNNTKKTD